MAKVKHYFKRLLILTALIPLSSCSSDKEEIDNTHNRVILAYLASDNNLSSAGYIKASELAKGYKGETGTKLYIFHDPANGTPYLNIFDGGQKATEDMEELNSADSKVFAQLCRRIVSENPGADFGLIIFSHSTGWLPYGTLENPSRSIAVDNTNGMELADFSDAIPDGTFDFIVFESCYSAGVEVAYELRHKANYFVMSSAEILDPGFAYIYKEKLSSLFGFNGAPVTFAQSAFSYFDNLSGLLSSSTLSVISTQQLEALASFLKGKATYSVTSPDTGWQYFDRNNPENKNIRMVYDFADYFSAMIAESDRSELTRLTGQCVLYKASTDKFLDNDFRQDGFIIKSHCGLTSFVPQPAIPELNEEYKKTAWYKAVFN